MDEAITKIRQLIDEQLILPSCSVRSRYFEEQACARWAAFEILECILEESERLPAHLTDRPMVTAADIATMFRDELDYCIYAEGAEPKDSIFYAARQTAEDIIHLVS